MDRDLRAATALQTWTRRRASLAAETHGTQIRQSSRAEVRRPCKEHEGKLRFARAQFPNRATRLPSLSASRSSRQQVEDPDQMIPGRRFLAILNHVALAHSASP